MKQPKNQDKLLNSIKPNKSNCPVLLMMKLSKGVKN